MRRGFGLVQALIVIVLISGIMMIAMKYATLSVKQTSDVYVREGAELFMSSAIEATLLAISGYQRDATNGCLEQVNVLSKDARYKADVNITGYFLLAGSADIGYCDRNISIQTEDSHGMVMLEIVVETNATHPKNEGKHVRLLRRTLQRP
ncbi:MAG: hypothetical protein PHN38_09140 [Sulfurospirillaceae bacterium]|nr:hypothetical protein [Sulfurospirillaceae bacterium]